MVRLSELTSVFAVTQALEEFRAFGRDDFLELYGFQRSRDYFVRIGSELFDSKPLVAAAWGHQFPEQGPLTSGDFSGGAEGAVRPLRKLGFDVVTRAGLRPPKLGDEYSSRTHLYEAYGGDKVAGIIRFPGDSVVNIFSDASGPYADEAPSLAAEFGYRGEGLSGTQRVGVGGNALLEDARLTRSAVRFWYRPIGGNFSFLTWVAVLGRAWVEGVGADKQQRIEIDWRLQAVPSPEPGEWPGEVTQTSEEAASAVQDGDDGVPEVGVPVTYADLLRSVDHRGQPRRASGVVRADFQRSAAARRAVLARSGGRCESPFCTGMPAELNRRGEPILDVDHIKDLALGGSDHPLNMAAICPNCHASKTRGRNAAQWRTALERAVRTAHAKALTPEPDQQQRPVVLTADGQTVPEPLTQIAKDTRH
jgi:5-methylcytosine-specific restriction protein A